MITADVLALASEISAAENLDVEAAIVAALDRMSDLHAYARAWDQAAGYLLMPEGDTLAPDGLRV